MKIQVTLNDIKIIRNDGGWVELPGNILYGTSLSQYMGYLRRVQLEISPEQCIKVLLWILGEK